MATRITFSILGDTQIDRTLEGYERASDMRPVWEVLANRFTRAEQRQFATEGSYGGSRWLPLSPKYAAWKLRTYGPKPILQREGDLMASLTRRPLGVEVIEPGFAIFGTAVEYAGYHQEGSGVPKRPPVSLPEAERRAWIREIQYFLRYGRTM